jgi:hypothetical protein
MLTTLRRAVIVLPLAWTGVWLGYYGGFNSAAAYTFRAGCLVVATQKV